jgi:SAM-dependent methyltransferase
MGGAAPGAAPPLAVSPTEESRYPTESHYPTESWYPTEKSSVVADVDGPPPWEGSTDLSATAPGGFVRHRHLAGAWFESPWPDEVFATPTPPGIALQSRAGNRIDLDPQRWHNAPCPADLALLARTRGTVLDIGCGPGRLVHALVLAGRVALGIDVSAAAVASARRRGAPAVRTSVFGPVPSAGQWGTALLLDGNIGIGGDAARLLRHTASLIAPAGLILVEVDSPSTVSEDVEVRVDLDGRVGSWFRWSRIAAGDMPALAQDAGLAVDEVWQHSGRWFAALASDLASEAEAAS